MADKLTILHNKTIDYQNDALNIVGATTDITIRTLETVAGDIAYVRKFGTPYLIKEVTDIEDPIDSNMTFEVYALDGTLLGSRVGGGAFSAGSVLETAQASYLKIIASGGAVTVLTGITITTDIDAGGLEFACVGNSITDGDNLIVYLSDTGSTYYEESLIYGGARHTPALNNTRKPYMSLSTAYSAVGATDGVIILDSEKYGSIVPTTAGVPIMAALGQTPELIYTVGAENSKYRDNLFYTTGNCVFFNENGNDSTGDGSWHKPYATPAVSIAAARISVYGGKNCGGDGIFNTAKITIPDVNPAKQLIADYGYAPTLRNAGNNTILEVSSEWGTSIQGIKFQKQGAYTINAIEVKNYAVSTASTLRVNLCDFTDLNYAIYSTENIANNFYNNIFTNCAAAFYGVASYANGASGNRLWIQGNIIHDCTNGIVLTQTANNSFTIYNNLIYDITEKGISYVAASGDWRAEAYINNNTIYNCAHGIYFTGAGTKSGTIKNNIVFGCVTYDLFLTGAACTVTYTNYGTNSGFTIGAGVSTADPEFNDLANNLYGLSPKSPGYRTGDNVYNMGYNFPIIDITANDIIISGLKLNGQDFATAGILIVNTYTGGAGKWITAYNISGSGIDIWDDNVNPDFEMVDCIAHDCGNGAAFKYTGSTIHRNIFYDNLIGLYAGNAANDIQHNVFYQNYYGCYFGSDFVGTCKNNIFFENLTYDAYAVSAYLTLKYNRITNVNTNIIISSSTNVTSNPLFINPAEYNFNIFTIEAGYKFECPCKDKADDGYDLGAYLITRGIINYYFSKFEADIHPDIFSESVEAKGHVQLEDITGGLNNYAKAHKRVFNIGWSADMFMLEAQRKELEYIVSQIPTAENNLPLNNDNHKLLFLPDSHIVESSGVVSTTAKTLTDSTATYKPNELKGFWADICRYHSDTYGTADQYLSVISITGAAFTINQLEGYFLKYGGSYYYIKSNTGVTITVSDPNEELPASLTEWQIVKFFRIVRNTNTVLYLSDDAAELLDGTYKYIVDFIEVKIQDPAFAYSQVLPFDYEREYDKTGYTLTVEES